MDKMIGTMTESELSALIRQSVSEAVEDALTRAQQKEPLGRLLNKHDAARLLSCSISTIDNLRRAGRLTPHRFGKKAARFDRDQVLSMAEQKPTQPNQFPYKVPN